MPYIVVRVSVQIKAKMVCEEVLGAFLHYFFNQESVFFASRIGNKFLSDSESVQEGHKCFGYVSFRRTCMHFEEELIAANLSSEHAESAYAVLGVNT